MELGACHECASGSNLAFHVDFCSQIHRVWIFCGGLPHGVVESRKQAIAIGLSEARKKGAKVPRKES